jgi:hypothetical protein
MKSASWYRSMNWRREILPGCLRPSREGGHLGKKEYDRLSRVFDDARIKSEMVLKSNKTEETVDQKKPGHGYWELINGSFLVRSEPANLLKGLVAGEGFEPSTFGL